MRLRIVLTWKRLAGLVALGMAGALFVGWSGLVSIAASSGHWPVTRWFLGWTLENAVATQSTPVEKPEGLDLSDPALIQRSAGNYATSCAACHGAPGVAQSPVVANMVPSPPRLEDSVGDWSDECVDFGKRPADRRRPSHARWAAQRNEQQNGRCW